MAPLQMNSVLEKLPYAVIVAETAYNMSVLVSDAMKRGYEPKGNIVITDHRYAQAMILVDKAVETEVPGPRMVDVNEGTF